MSLSSSQQTASTMNMNFQNAFTDDAVSPSPFLRLPLEIRLMIYEHMLCPSSQPSTGHATSVTNLLPDFNTYYSPDTNADPFTLSVRTVDPWMNAQNKAWRRRSTYRVRTGPFLTTTTPTTYRVLLSPYTAHLRQTVPSLLGINQQVHAEASKILYSTYTFAFHTSIEAVVPFLSDLTPLSRSHVRHLSITKKALPYTKEFDRAEWSSLCTYLAACSALPLNPDLDLNAPQTPLINLRSIRLNVVAGKPDSGWSAITAPTAADFATLLRMKQHWGGGGVDIEWAEQLMAVKGLERLDVRPLVEHCARPASDKLAFWVAFSKSVDEGGFGEWLRGVMVGARGD